VVVPRVPALSEAAQAKDAVEIAAATGEAIAVVMREAPLAVVAPATGAAKVPVKSTSRS
jgi:hypothetical protein